eukprot:scaffold53659_cov31-Tisochrysis_lutea.AAC.4
MAMHHTVGLRVTSQADMSGNRVKKSFHAFSACLGSYFLFGSLDSGSSIFCTRSRRSPVQGEADEGIARLSPPLQVGRTRRLSMNTSSPRLNPKPSPGSVMLSSIKWRASVKDAVRNSHFTCPC